MILTLLNSANITRTNRKHIINIGTLLAQIGTNTGLTSDQVFAAMSVIAATLTPALTFIIIQIYKWNKRRYNTGGYSICDKDGNLIHGKFLPAPIFRRR